MVAGHEYTVQIRLAAVGEWEFATKKGRLRITDDYRTALRWKRNLANLYLAHGVAETVSVRIVRRTVGTWEGYDRLAPVGHGWRPDVTTRGRVIGISGKVSKGKANRKGRGKDILE